MPVAEPKHNLNWWRAACWDHPGWSQRVPGSIANPDAAGSGRKPKVFCKACWPILIAAEEAKDVSANHTVRSRAIIEDSLWAPSASENPHWMQGRAETILRHLASCPHVTQNDRDRAKIDKIERGLQKSPSRHGSSQIVQPVYLSNPIAPLNYNLNPSTPTVTDYPSHNALAGPSSHPYAVAGPSIQPYAAAGPSTLPIMSAPNPGLIFSALPPATPSPLALSTHLRSGSLPGTPSPNPSPHDSPYMLSASLGKRRKVSRQTSITIAPAQWTSALQAQFETHIARITASCGLPFRWIEDVEVIDFLSAYIPQADVPSRRVLSDRLIPAEVEKYRASAREDAKGHLATIQCDGWTGGNNHHLLAFMMTTSKRGIHVVRVYDTSADRKTAEELLAKMKEVKEHVEQVWGVTVIAITSDASGESARARRDIVQIYPHLLVPDCYGHQINLVVKDYFEVPYTLFLLETADEATELVTWLRGKTFVLAKLRMIQETNHSKVLSVIRAVISRWTAHYLAFKRLLDLRLSLQIMVEQDRALPASNICTGKRAAREKGEAMFDIIEKPSFWHNLLRLKRHLEPLALAANITQLTHVRPDQVLIIFGLLYTEYQVIRAEENIFETDLLIRGILESIEKRWAKADQEVFIAAVILNPLYKLLPFMPIDLTTLAHLTDLLKKLYLRFFGTLTTADSSLLFSEIEDYIDGVGQYVQLDAYAQNVLRRARENGEPVDPVKIWDGVRHRVQPQTPLQRLAHRLHSITVNSASCERLFSIFGTTLTRLRSRLRTQSMVNLAELRLHIRNEHVQSGRMKQRLKRKMTTHHLETDAVGDGVAAQGTGDPNGEGEDDEDSGPQPSTSRRPRSFRNTLSQTCGASTTDETTHIVSGARSRRIVDLFDFTNEAWTKIAKEYALRGLNEEQEFYELVDLDAAGEDDEELDGVLQEMNELSSNI